jgi:hypothetical protein
MSLRLGVDLDVKEINFVVSPWSAHVAQMTCCKDGSLTLLFSHIVQIKSFYGEFCNGRCTLVALLTA